jgi:alkylation response protein AidB-like acyl-CoA dehydrogenase
MSGWHRAIDEALGALRAMADDGASQSALLAQQFELGLAWPRFAVGAGGLGVSAVEARVIRERVIGAGLPSSPASFVGLQQASALIHDVGSEVQRQRYLRRIFTGEDQWCQLFSEPGAGSDLANVGTRGRLQGDRWRFDGQKVWTSMARHSTHAMLLARTDPTVPKHQGMTMFVLEMLQPGVEVRPLRQMDGGARFNEVFLSEATALDSDRLGAPGAGWAMSMQILNVERDGATELFHRPVQEILDLARSRAASAEVFRDDIIRLWIQARLNFVSGQRGRATKDVGEKARVSGVAKIAASEHAQQHAELLTLLLGVEAVTGADYDRALEEDTDPKSVAPKDFAALSPHRFILRVRAMSIEGGTNEISRNIVGERVLGLPPDVRVDKGKPWQDLARS